MDSDDDLSDVESLCGSEDGGTGQPTCAQVHGVNVEPTPSYATVQRTHIIKYKPEAAHVMNTIGECGSRHPLACCRPATAHSRSAPLAPQGTSFADPDSGCSLSASWPPSLDADQEAVFSSQPSVSDKWSSNEEQLD